MYVVRFYGLNTGCVWAKVESNDMSQVNGDSITFIYLYIYFLGAKI